jgi:hypothetical protein
MGWCSFFEQFFECFTQPSGPGWDSFFTDVGGMPSQGARTPEMREVHYGDLDGKLQSSNSRYGG